MLTKVSYNAYASSANGMHRQNQSQNVNFGMLGFGNTKVFEEFSHKFLPAHLITHLIDFNKTMLYSEYGIVSLETATDFLKACKQHS